MELNHFIQLLLALLTAQYTIAQSPPNPHTITANNGVYTYQYCQHDPPDSPAFQSGVLYGYPVQYNNLTLELCTTLCAQNDWAYSATTSGFRCYCANYYNSTAQNNAPVSNCNYACMSNTTEFCGGDHYNTVYLNYQALQRYQQAVSSSSAASRASASSVSAASRSAATSAQSASRASALSAKSAASVSKQSSLSAASASRASVSSARVVATSNQQASRSSAAASRSAATIAKSMSRQSVLSSKSASIAASKAQESSSRASVRSSVLSSQSVHSASLASGRASQSSVAATHNVKSPITLNVYSSCVLFDPSNPALNLNPHKPGMSLEVCANLCVNHTYFGVAQGSQCYCGDTLNNPTTIDGGQCFAPASASACPGNTAENCGARSAMQLYGVQSVVGNCPASTSIYDNVRCTTITGHRSGATTGATRRRARKLRQRNMKERADEPAAPEPSAFMQARIPVE